MDRQRLLHRRHRHRSWLQWAVGFLWLVGLTSIIVVTIGAVVTLK